MTTSDAHLGHGLIGVRRHAEVQHLPRGDAKGPHVTRRRERAALQALGGLPLELRVRMAHTHDTGRQLSARRGPPPGEALLRAGSLWQKPVTLQRRLRSTSTLRALRVCECHRTHTNTTVNNYESHDKYHEHQRTLWTRPNSATWAMPSAASARQRSSVAGGTRTSTASRARAYVHQKDGLMNTHKVKQWMNICIY